MFQDLTSNALNAGGRAVHQLGHTPKVQRHVHTQQGKKETLQGHPAKSCGNLLGIISKEHICTVLGIVHLRNV